MTTYKCTKCGKKLILSSKPSQCDVCGSQKFKTLASPTPAKEKSDNTSPTSKGVPTPPWLLGAKEKPSPTKTPQATVIQGTPTVVKGDFDQVTPPSKSRKKSGEPSLPLYSSSSSELPPPRVKTSPKPLNPHPKNSLSWPRWWGVAMLILVLGIIGYQFWQRQRFNTEDFQKIVLNETFKRPRGWFLGQGSLFKNGGLFQQQPRPNHYSAAFWRGKNFTDLDFSAVVRKTAGPAHFPFGLMARVNGSKSENFYYLFIDGQGRFSLGKRQKDQWLTKVDWQKNRVIKKGNSQNTLRIVCKGDLIFGYINNKFIGSFQDKDYPSGKIGLFSGRSQGASTSIYFDNVLVKEKSSVNKTPSPQEFVQNYYSSSSKENDPFWNVVENVDIYKITVLNKTASQAKIKAWVKYEMQNGLVVCESRIFNLKLDASRNQWTVDKFEEITPQSNCPK